MKDLIVAVMKLMRLFGFVVCFTFIYFALKNNKFDEATFFMVFVIWMTME